MNNGFLYLITVLIWGSTWFAIEFQLGKVAVEISIIYRFGLAALIILLISKLRGLPLTFTMSQHYFLALLGLLNFSLNYFVLYEAQKYLSSAMTSIGFSMLLLVNIINTRLFFGKKIAFKTYIGAVFGITGIIVLFWPEVSTYQTDSGSLTGLGLIIAGVFFASFGNMVSVRNSNHNFPVFQSIGWAMLYGTAFMVIIAWFKDTPFTFSFEPGYLISLAYLIIFGSVIAFYSYYYLLNSIGTEKTSYSVVLFPVIAVIISSFYEAFEWTEYTILGFILVATGNILMLLPVQRIRSFAASFFWSLKKGKITSAPIQDCVTESAK